MLKKFNHKYSDGGQIGNPLYRAYYMTLSEYLDKVVPIIKELKALYKKNHYFVTTGYSNLNWMSYPELVELKNKQGKIEGSVFFNFSPEKMSEKYSMGADKELEYGWNDRSRGFPTPPSKNAPKEIVDKKNLLLNQLNYLFNNRLTSDADNLKSNKRIIKAAIDYNIYQRDLQDGIVTTNLIEKVADSAGVRLPKKLYDDKVNKQREVAKKYDKIYAELPPVNKAVLQSMIEAISAELKPLEEEIYEKELVRYMKNINELLDSDEVSEITMRDRLSFYRRIFNIQNEFKKDKVVKKMIFSHDEHKNIYVDSIVKEAYLSGLSLKQDYKSELDSEIFAFIEVMKVQLLTTIIANFQKITKPIVEIRKIYLEWQKGKGSLAGEWKFIFNDGSSFDFKTQAIGAGGYNIQCYHFRYISDFTNIVLADGSKPESHSHYSVNALFSIKQDSGLKKFKTGGELQKGIRVEREHANTLRQVYNHNINLFDAPKYIAKDHLKELPDYYTRLDKMEHGKKFAEGGVIDWKSKVGKSQNIQEARALIIAINQDIFDAGVRAKTAITEIDWGPMKRGQGKRVGHMVTGSMSGAPRGVKKYYGIDLSDYSDDLKNDPTFTKFSNSGESERYAMARMYGCNHIEARFFAIGNSLGYFAEGGGVEGFDFGSLFNNDTSNYDPQETIDEQREEAYSKLGFDLRWAATYQEAKQKLIDQYKTAKTAKDTWQSKQYKSAGKSSVFVGDELSGADIKIDKINRQRRENAIKNAQLEMDDAIRDLKMIGLTDDEIQKELEIYEDGGEIPEKIGNSYNDRIQANYKFMNTEPGEWSAVPVIGTSSIEVNGKTKEMPTFDFPKGYATAPSLFKMGNSGLLNCELCGKNNITTLYYVKNDAKKWTMAVGSECVTHFGDAKSGKQNVRQFKIETAKIVDADISKFAKIIFDNFSRIKDAGYGKKERVWSNSYLNGEGSEYWDNLRKGIAILNPSLVFKKNQDKNVINWKYVWNSLPIFNYQSEIEYIKHIPISRFIKNPDGTLTKVETTVDEVDKKLLSWFTRKGPEAIEMIRELSGILALLKTESFLNDTDIKSEYMESLNLRKEANNEDDDTVKFAKGGPTDNFRPSTINPSLLKIKYPEEMQKVAEMANNSVNREEWAKKVDWELPVKLSKEDGQYFLEDGYMQFYACRILGYMVNVKQEQAPIKKKKEKGGDIYITPDDLSAFKNIVLKDEMRPNLSGVFFDQQNSMVVATDANKMLIVRQAVPKQMFINPKTGAEVDAKFPDYVSVVPVYTKVIHEIDLRDWSEKLKDWAAFNKKQKTVFMKHRIYMDVDDEQVQLDPQLLYELMQALIKLGYPYADIGFDRANRALSFLTLDGKTTGLFMPMQPEDVDNIDSVYKEQYHDFGKFKTEPATPEQSQHIALVHLGRIAKEGGFSTNYHEENLKKELKNKNPDEESNYSIEHHTEQLKLAIEEERQSANRYAELIENVWLRNELLKKVDDRLNKLRKLVN